MLHTAHTLGHLARRQVLVGIRSWFFSPSVVNTVVLLLCRANLHVVLCLSPVGEAFRERCRMFPGLVNCTTTDWFMEWPADALYEVATRQMAALDLGNEEIKQAVCKVIVSSMGS